MEVLPVMDQAAASEYFPAGRPATMARKEQKEQSYDFQLSDWFFGFEFYGGSNLFQDDSEGTRAFKTEVIRGGTGDFIRAVANNSLVLQKRGLRRTLKREAGENVGNYLGVVAFEKKFFRCHKVRPCGLHLNYNMSSSGSYSTVDVSTGLAFSL